MKFIAMAAALALHAPIAAAVQEETLEFEGRWKVTVQPPAGTTRQALLVLSNYGGEWKERPTAASRRAACKSNKPYPVTVQKSVTSELEFSVWSAAVSAGCANLSITVAPTGPKTLAGSTAEGHAVVMTRQ